MNEASNRSQIVQQHLHNVRQIALQAPVTRESLAQILEQLELLASARSLWESDAFPPPEGDQRQARYLISEDGDKSFALYLNVMLPGKKIVPHNHTTWATIAAVEGVEFNHLYESVEGGFVAGPAKIRHTGTVEVRPGRGIALLPDDVHAVEIKGEAPIRHLHLYGRALEALQDRLCFDLERDQCSIMPIGVQTRR
jgi:predicted metal-dependent enzyme (double-stranded beta helix superfamily)